jgi:hypothetical protein
MALQINTGLTTTDGGTVYSGSYLIFSTSFPARGLNYSVELRIYRSLAALDAGLQSIKVIQIPVYFYTKNLTEQEFASLTPVVIHDDVKAFLEGYVGVGNVDVIF